MDPTGGRWTLDRVFNSRINSVVVEKKKRDVWVSCVRQPRTLNNRDKMGLFTIKRYHTFSNPIKFNTTLQRVKAKPKYAVLWFTISTTELASLLSRTSVSTSDAFRKLTRLTLDTNTVTSQGYIDAVEQIKFPLVPVRAWLTRSRSRLTTTAVDELRVVLDRLRQVVTTK